MSLSTAHLTAPDGTSLAYHLTGEGHPLVCLPGGPMLESAYFRDLGGLDAHRQLVLLDLRGTGDSDVPVDPTSYRCDRQVADVEALRVHLGLDQLELLGHSAGANLAYRYVEAHPDRVSRLVLVAPSPRGVGVDGPADERAAVAESRSAEPWYAEAAAAFARVRSGTGTDADWALMTPFSYGRWDEEIRAYDAWMEDRRHAEAAEIFAEGYDPETTRPAVGRLEAPVVLLSGGVDLGNPPQAMAEVAGLFRSAEHVVQPGAGHFPWVDDPEAFRALLAPYLA